MGDTPVQSVRKAFDLLSILALEDPHQHGIALSAIAARVGLSPATARNLLKSILPSGFVAQKPDSRYVLGPSALQMTELHRLATEPARGVILQALAAASASYRETTVLAALVSGRRVQLYSAAADQPVRVDEASVEERSIYSTATGRILTAYASAEELAQILRRWGLPGEQWDGIDTEAALREALDGLRRLGKVTILAAGGQITALACPILDASGGQIAAIGAHAPTYRCPASQQERITGELRRQAEALSNALRPVL